MNILERIIETKKSEIAEKTAKRSFGDIYRDALGVQRQVISFSKAINDSNTGIIAEFKRHSPSKGDINAGASLEKTVTGYEANGAAAVSVLTDGPYFGGSLDDLAQARQLVNIPLLRKDFIIDPYQICEARIYGADAVLLIAAALEPSQVEGLASFAHGFGMEVLLEIHNKNELPHIIGEIDVVGVNNRNLGTFVTNTSVSLKLADMIPPGIVKISESGISSPEKALELREAGYQGFLMGEAFMKEPDPAEALADFIKKIKR